MKKREIIERLYKLENTVMEMAKKVSNKTDQIEEEIDQIIHEIHRLQEKK